VKQMSSKRENEKEEKAGEEGNDMPKVVSAAHIEDLQQRLNSI